MGIKLDSTGRAGLLLALAIGSWFVWRYFPAGFVAGTSSYWMTEVDDVTQYFSGFNAFFSAPFSYPLLAFDSINYPQGTRATFMDVIPLYALLLKVFVPASLAPFNPFGAWVALSCIGQAVCAWWILRELQVKSWLALVALVVCLLTFPAFTTRVTHISLMTHWIMLSSLALYVRARRTEEPQRWAWTLLLVGGFYINIYLFVMASAVYVASYMHNPGRHRLAEMGRALLPFLILGASLFLTILPMEKAEVGRENGFGIFSMNLLAPFYGGKYLVIADAERPGQYEGFNYLGLGVLLAFALSLALGRGAALKRFKEHWALTLLMVLFTVYALSDAIYLGQREVVTFHYPSFMDFITSQFRASGRFFWPVGYCVVIFGIAMLYRKLGARAFAASMLVLIALQVADLSKLRHRMHDTVYHQSEPVLDQTTWDRVTANDVQYLYFFPKFKCGRSDLIFKTLMPTMRYAVVHGIKINTGYVSRVNANCATESIQAEIASSAPDQSLYVFVKGDFPQVEQVKVLFQENRQPTCEELDFAYICRLQRTGSGA